MAMSSAYYVTWQVWVTGMSFTKRMKSSGLRMLPCRVPPSSCTTSDRVSPILTWMVLSVRNEEIILRMSLGSSMSWSFFSRPLCHTASNALSTSMSSSAASFLLSLTFFMYLFMIIMCSFASLCGWYPSFRQLSKTLVSSHIAGSGRFFKAMYGIVSSPGLVLFLRDFRAFVVSSVVTFLEYSSDGA